jgi:hypothetical protein
MFKIRAFFFIATLFTHLYVRVCVLLACGKHSHDRIILVRDEIWVHKSSSIPPLFIEVHVPS